MDTGERWSVWSSEDAGVCGALKTLESDMEIGDIEIGEMDIGNGGGIG